MKPRYIFIFSWLFLILTGSSLYTDAQELNRSDSLDTSPADDKVTVTEPVSIDSVDRSPDSLRVGGSRNRFELFVDYLKLVSFASSQELKMEGGLGYISKINVALNLEFGYGEKTPDDFYKNADYKVYGYYGRAGLSYYYPYKPGVNFIIGVRYAMSQYQDEATFSILSSLWDDYEDGFTRENLEASWAELVLGSESSVKGILYFGFSFRLRFLIEGDNFSPFEVYSIPGYGRTFDNIVPALNLYIKLLVPFGKARQVK